MGIDRLRLAQPGDFNIEIDRTELRSGANEIVIEAEVRSAEPVRRTVNIDFTPNQTATLPYRIDWSEVDDIQDVAEVVDGLWRVEDGGVRTVEPYYDRVIAIGDMSWTDYEVTTTVVYHSMFPDEISRGEPPYSGHSHASLLLRWQGHDDDGEQPRVKWWPCGGLAMLRADVDGDGSRWVWNGCESWVLAEEEVGRTVELGVEYRYRAQVASLPGPRTRYAVKAWRAAAAEPADWDLVAMDGAEDLASGSVLLVAHHADVTFGPVEVRPLDRGSGQR